MNIIDHLLSLGAIDAFIQILEEFVHALDLFVPLFPDLFQHLVLFLTVELVSRVSDHAVINLS